MMTDLMTSTYARRLSAMLAREPWWLEFWSAATGVLWAALAYAGAERLGDWPSMRVLLEIGSDRFWHLLAFGLGFFQLMGLAAGFRWSRWWAALAMGWFWGLLAMGVWVAAPWSPLGAVYAGWCGVNVLSVLRTISPMHPPCFGGD